MKAKNRAILFAMLAAALYAMNVPLSKILLNYVEPMMMAAFLYLGAGIGLLVYGSIARRWGAPAKQEPLSKKELPYTLGMVLLDIAAPILLMAGIAGTTAANVSLLNNFEIVVTSVLALFLFKEVISKRLWCAICLVTVASIILSFEGTDAFIFNEGSLMVLGACVCWGFENNCTKMLSNKSSVEIVVIKGNCSGLGSLILALASGESFPALRWIPVVLLLGFVAYGLSIHFYIRAQKELGAAKTSAYYSFAPFLGVAFSMLLLGERLTMRFFAALLIMLISTILMARDTIMLQHTHEHVHVHTHEHRHGELVHTHEHSHRHTHMHVHKNDADEHRHAHRGFWENHSLEEHHHAHSAHGNL